MATPRQTRQTAKNNLIYGVVLGLLLLERLIPRQWGLWFFELLGRLVFLIPSNEKRTAVSQLSSFCKEHNLPEKPSRAAAAVYANLGKNAFDALRLAHVNDTVFNAIVSWQGLEPFKAAYNRRKGVIVITAHLGCFEMLLNFFGRQGFASFAVGQKLYDDRLDKIISRARRGANMSYVHRADNPRVIIRKLQAGQAFGALIDQDTAVEGVFAHFLGRPAYTPSGPIKLALRYEIPVFVATTARVKGEKHKIWITPLPLEKNDDFEKEVVINVEAANLLLGNKIAEFPLQWVWMHRRWRRTPAETAHKTVPGATNHA